MLTNRLAVFRRTARLLSRGGFTLVELLVVIGIIAILAGVALGPITRGITQAKESGAMQVTRQIGLAEFAYSNDNGQTYLYTNTSTANNAFAYLLLAGNYVSDPSIFYIAGTPGQSKGTGTGSANLAATNVSFDFLYNTGGSGLSSSAADGTPMVFGIGITSLTIPTSGAASPSITPSTTSFGTDGITVTYKSNSAQFFKATNSTLTSFISSSYNDPVAGSYVKTSP